MGLFDSAYNFWSSLPGNSPKTDDMSFAGQVASSTSRSAPAYGTNPRYQGTTSPQSSAQPGTTTDYNAGQTPTSRLTSNPVFGVSGRQTAAPSNRPTPAQSWVNPIWANWSDFGTGLQGDASGWYSSQGYDTSGTGIPWMVSQNGSAGYLLGKGSDGSYHFVKPSEAYTPATNAYDQNFVNQIRSETQPSGWPWDPSNEYKNKINQFLDAHPAGQALSQSDADAFGALLDQLDPKGDARRTLNSTLGGASHLKDGYIFADGTYDWSKVPKLGALVAAAGGMSPDQAAAWQNYQANNAATSDAFGTSNIMEILGRVLSSGIGSASGGSSFDPSYLLSLLGSNQNSSVGQTYNPLGLGPNIQPMTSHVFSY